ncbi:TonB-dependent receptor domain-containing protein [Arcticibacter sp. MXS-1]|uniref:TonB-dependent receptor n=1 Tax=Arcticibacter sp. MXS-1 TaxID=3341726 RepID=UPI0035A88214
MRKFLLFTLLALLGVATLHAQVTTSSITGLVRDAKGDPMIGATVRATHQPTGTRYGVSTNADGRFTLPNVRIGGPYVIEVSYIGLQSQKFTNISLRLGEPYILNVTLSNSGTALSEVVVTGKKGINVARTGASTNISREQIATLPTITRSITDYTRLTPQSNGNNFAGRDNRYNNVLVDGANLNNTFGLSTDPLPGGGAQPISIEAYDEISVNLSPFDVKQSGFTGAGINAVTRSGTNTFHGSAYGFYRDQSFNGTHARERDLSASNVKSKNQVYGATLGGPIIKDKLFFFANFEYEKAANPGITYSPTGGSGIGNISSTTASDLELVKAHLAKYNYDTGTYDNFPSFNPENTKFLLKLDWNINDVHKLTVKYSDLSATSDVALNGSSIPNGGGFRVTGNTSSLSRLPNNRFSNNSMAFSNSNYGFKNPVKTATAELNSNFGGKMSNQLLLALTKSKSTRTFDGPVFPTIDIFNGSGANFISAGMDPYTYNNDVVTDSYNIVDNYTYYAGKHTITVGGSYEYQKVGNMFMAGSNSYYAYSSLSDFLEDRAPAYYAYTYSLVPGKSAVYSAELKIGQLGFYAQDEFNPNPNFKLTYGIRADRPIYHENPLENPQITALQLPNKEGVLTSYNTGAWPKARWLFSPRAGFRWSLLEDNSLIVRGGLGIFTGRIPFVYLTNMPTNSGMYQNGGAITNPAVLANIKFSSDPAAYASLFPQTAGSTVPKNFVAIDNNFKFPQVFRTNLAVEKGLGNGFNVSLEALITKDINAVRMRNANLKAPTGTITEGEFNRPRYVSTANTDRYIYPDITSAIVLENTNKGYSTAYTAQISKTGASGLSGSLAYTYTKAKEVTANPGNQASSIWNTNPNVGTSNDIEMGYSAYATPHRVVGTISYKVKYAKNFASSLSLFYQGSKNDNPYSYIVNGDLNGDGNNSTDLLYVPKNMNEIIFQQLDIQDNNKNVLYSYTPAQQAVAFEQFINNTPYLKSRRGQYAERNAAFRPWYNRVDMRFLQDFVLERGGVKHNLQFSVDVLNVPNLLNKNWGVLQSYTINNPLVYKGIDATTNKPIYTMQVLSNKLVTEPYQYNYSLSSTWSMQLGVKYIF